MAKSRRRIFFDANILFAGCHSPSGGSGLLMEASVAGVFKPVVSELVVAEARQALKLKSRSDALSRLYAFLGLSELDLMGIPTPKQIEPYLELIVSKDSHVLASSVAGGVDCLLTLDRKHFFTPKLRRADLPFAIMTPAEFLKSCREDGQFL